MNLLQLDFYVEACETVTLFGSHSLYDLPPNTQIFQLFPAYQMKRQFLFTTEQRESSRQFSTASIKQMLMEDEKTFDGKACSGSSPSPYQLILANWK